ncbi:MAG: hypothetical protein ACPGED_05200, partial [Flavobacteriales bacterium]
MKKILKDLSRRNKRLWLSIHEKNNGNKIEEISLPQTYSFYSGIQITLIQKMPSRTRSRSRGRSKKTSQKEKAQITMKKTESHTVTPSNGGGKKLNISGHPILKQKSLTTMWPTQVEALEEAENKVQNAQKHLDELQKENADEDALAEAKYAVEDAITDQQATIASYDYDKMEPSQRDLLVEVDAELAAFEKLKFDLPPPPSPSTEDSNTDSESEPDESEKQSDASSYEGIEEISPSDDGISQTIHTQHEVTANPEQPEIQELDNDSVATPPRSNSKEAKLDKVLQDKPSLTPSIPSQNDLQVKITESLKKISPSDKVRLMVSNARKKAQDQVQKMQMSKEKQPKASSTSSKIQTKISDKLKSTKKSVRKSKAGMVDEQNGKSKKSPTKVKSKRSSSTNKPNSAKKENRYEVLASSDEEVKSATSESEYNDDESTVVSDNEEETKSQATPEKPPKISKRNQKITKQTDIRANKRQHSTLITLKLKVKKSKDSVKEMIGKATAWIKTMQILDPTIVIYEYHAKNQDSVINHHKKIPKEIELFKKFFSGANPQIGEGHVWCQVSLGHDEPISNLKASLQGWSTENDTFIYIKRLQHKDTVREYFLLWSTQKMDTEKLHEATTQAIKRYTKSTLVFAFVWAVIRKEKGYTVVESKAEKGKQYIRALHIEVPRENKEMTYAILSKLFSSKSNTQILRRDLRMVPVLRKEITGYDRRKITHLIEKQERYLSTIDTVECYDLGDIDYLQPKLKMTLRDMIMELKTLRTFDPNNQSIQIFTSIDYTTWPQPCHALTFPKYLQSEAHEYIASLPSFLVWCYGEEVLNMMNPEAIRKAMESPWDPEEMRAITPQSMELDAIMQEASTMVPWVDEEEEEIIPNISQIAKDFVFRH